MEDAGQSIQQQFDPIKAGIRSGKIRRRNAKNIAGKRYGRLVAIEPTEKRDYKGSVIWHCRCDCGKELDVSYDGLTYGNYYSCGCRKRELQENVFDTLTFVDNTCLEWLEKRKYRSDNTSGLRGVVLRSNGHYSVNIGFKQKRYYLGTYGTYEEAVEVRLKAEEMIHGGFIRACQRMQKQAQVSGDTSNRLIFEIRKGEGYIEIESNDLEEDGHRIEF